MKSSFNPLLAAGGVLAGLATAHLRQSTAVAKDSVVSFPTWSERRNLPMGPMLTSRRVAGRRRVLRRPRRYVARYVPRPVSGDRSMYLTRCTALGAVSLTAGVGTFNQNVVMSQVQTSDLTPVWRQYKIVKAEFFLWPNVDFGNSGIANNGQAVVATCCDPEGSGGTTLQSISAFSNSRVAPITSPGQPFKYTFFPKVLNSVDVSGTASAAGSYQSNPWLTLNATGITVPHLRLYGVIQSNVSASVESFTYYIKYHFLVKGVA